MAEITLDSSTKRYSSAAPICIASAASRSKRTAQLNVIRCETMPASLVPIHHPATNNIANNKKTPITTTFRHPPYLQMIETAVEACDQGKGVSKVAIHNFIKQNYQVGETRMSLHVRNGIKQALREGILRENTGKFPSGTFKINARRTNVKSKGCVLPAAALSDTGGATNASPTYSVTEKRLKTNVACSGQTAFPGTTHANAAPADFEVQKNQSKSALKNRIKNLHAELVTIYMVPRTVRTFDRVHNNFQNPCFNVVCRKSSTLRSIFEALRTRFNTDINFRSRAADESEPEVIFYDPPSMPGDEPDLEKLPDVTAVRVGSHAESNKTNRLRRSNLPLLPVVAQKERRCWNSNDHRRTIVNDILTKPLCNEIHLSYDWNPPEIAADSHHQSSFLFSGIELALPNAAFQQHLEDLVLDLASLTSFTASSQQQIEIIRKKSRMTNGTLGHDNNNNVIRTRELIDGNSAAVVEANNNNNQLNNSCDNIAKTSDNPKSSRSDTQTSSPSSDDDDEDGFNRGATATDSVRSSHNEGEEGAEKRSTVDNDDERNDDSAADLSYVTSPSSPQTMEAASLLCTLRDSLLSPPPPANPVSSSSQFDRSDSCMSETVVVNETTHVEAYLMNDADDNVVNDHQDRTVQDTTTTTTILPLSRSPFIPSTPKDTPPPSVLVRNYSSSGAAAAAAGKTLASNSRIARIKQLAAAKPAPRKNRKRPVATETGKKIPEQRERTKKRTHKSTRVLKKPPGKKRQSAVAIGSASLHSILSNLPLDQLRVVPVIHDDGDDEDDGDENNKNNKSSGCALLQLPDDFDATKFQELMKQVMESGAYDTLSEGDRQLLSTLMSAVEASSGAGEKTGENNYSEANEKSCSSKQLTDEQQQQRQKKGEKRLRMSDSPRAAADGEVGDTTQFLTKKMRLSTVLLPTDDVSFDRLNKSHPVLAKKPPATTQADAVKNFLIAPRNNDFSTSQQQRSVVNGRGGTQLPAATRPILPAVQIVNYCPLNSRFVGGAASNQAKRGKSVAVRKDLASSCVLPTGVNSDRDLNGSRTKPSSTTTTTTNLTPLKSASRTAVSGGRAAHDSHASPKKISSQIKMSSKVRRHYPQLSFDDIAAKMRQAARSKQTPKKSSTVPESGDNIIISASTNEIRSSTTAATNTSTIAVKANRIPTKRRQRQPVNTAATKVHTEPATTSLATASTASADDNIFSYNCTISPGTPPSEQQPSIHLPLGGGKSPFATFYMQQQQQQQQFTSLITSQSMESPMLLLPSSSTPHTLTSFCMQEAVIGCETPHYTTLSALLPPPVDSHSLLFGCNGFDTSLTTSSLLNMPPIVSMADSTAVVVTSTFPATMTVVVGDADDDDLQEKVVRSAAADKLRLSVEEPSAVRIICRAEEDSSTEVVLDSGSIARNVAFSSSPSLTAVSSASSNRPLTRQSNLDNEIVVVASTRAWRPVLAMATVPVNIRKQQQHGGRRQQGSNAGSAARTVSGNMVKHAGLPPSPAVRPITQPVNYKKRALSRFLSTTTTANGGGVAATESATENAKQLLETAVESNDDLVRSEQQEIDGGELDSIKRMRQNAVNKTAAADQLGRHISASHSSSSLVVKSAHHSRNTSFAMDELSNNITCNSLNLSNMMLPGEDDDDRSRTSLINNRSAAVLSKPQTPPPAPLRALVGVDGVIYDNSPVPSAASTPRKSALIDRRKQPTPSRATSLHVTFAPTPVGKTMMIEDDGLHRKNNKSFRFGGNASTPTTPFVGARPLRTLSPIETSDNACFAHSPVQQNTVRKAGDATIESSPHGGLSGCRRTLFGRKRSSSSMELAADIAADGSASTTANGGVCGAALLLGQNSLTDFINADTQSLADSLAVGFLEQTACCSQAKQ